MTPVSKNWYIDKLDYIVNKQNNTCQRTIKMKPVDVKSNTYIDSSKDINDVRLVILLEYHDVKIFLQKVTLQMASRSFCD